MTRRKVDSVQALFLGIIVLAVVGTFLYRARGKPPHAVADIMGEQDMVLARTQSGLEVFVPSGRKSWQNVSIVVNGGFSAELAEVGPGVMAVPRSILRNQDGVAMPSEMKITHASVTLGYDPSGDGDYHVASFQWKWR